MSVLVDDCGGGRKGDRRGEMLPLRPRPCTAQLFRPPLLCAQIWAASLRGSFSFFVFSSAPSTMAKWKKKGRKEGRKGLHWKRGKERREGGKEERRERKGWRKGGREEGRMSRKDGRPGERRTREKRIPTPERASCLCRRKEGMKEGRKEGQVPRLKEGGTVRRTEGPCERRKEGREEWCMVCSRCVVHDTRHS